MKIFTSARPLRYCIAVGLFSLFHASVTAGTDFEYIGQQIIPNGYQFKGTTIGGLSALDYDPHTRRYYLISDDRSNARFYIMRFDLDKFERTFEAGMAGVHIDEVHLLTNAQSKPFRNNFVDPEGLRLDPVRHVLYWSEEGQRLRSGVRTPAVTVADLDGHFQSAMQVPEYYHPSGSVAGTKPGDRGVYDNLAFESVALTPSGKTVWTGLENGLTQDSPVATPTHGSLSRLLAFDASSGKPVHEYAYEVAPVVHPPILPHLLSINGLSDMVAVGEKQFITLERSFAIGAATPGERRTGVTIRLFYADAREATDVLGMPSIAGQQIKTVAKTLLLDLSQIVTDNGTPLVVDNLEGISFGPCYKGRPTLLLVSDNNFSMLQFTQIVALSVHSSLPAPLPACDKEN